VAFITAPGERVTRVVTDRGILRKLDGRMRVAAVPAGEGSLDDRVRTMVASCGWEAEVAREVAELDPVTPAEARDLREFDRRRQFLR
jgi:acyl CoA:acetate/3-ketoacid CoA transferase beta subunit